MGKNAATSIQTADSPTQPIAAQNDQPTATVEPSITPQYGRICPTEVKQCENGYYSIRSGENCEFECQELEKTCEPGSKAYHFTPFIYAAGKGFDICVPENWVLEKREEVFTPKPQEKNEMVFALQPYEQETQGFEPVFTVSTRGFQPDSGAFCQRKGQLLSVGPRTYPTYETFFMEGSVLETRCGTRMLHKSYEVPLNMQLIFFSIGVQHLPAEETDTVLQQVQSIVEDVIRTEESL